MYGGGEGEVGTEASEGGRGVGGHVRKGGRGGRGGGEGGEGLRIVYWQPFGKLAFNHCAQLPC